jgi:hypothetical protein
MPAHADASSGSPHAFRSKESEMAAMAMGGKTAHTSTYLSTPPSRHRQQRPTPLLRCWAMPAHADASPGSLHDANSKESEMAAMAMGG